MTLIPFVRLKPILTQAAFPGGPADYAEIVDIVRENLSGQRIRLVVDERTLIAGRHRLRLPHQLFAFYALLAKARKERWRPAPATGLDPVHYHGWMSPEDFADLSGPIFRPITPCSPTAIAARRLPPRNAWTRPRTL